MKQRKKPEWDYEGKDFIVVKDYRIAEKLSTAKIKSLEGKLIIVAPDGLEFVPLEELKKLKVITQELHRTRDEAIEETIDRIFRVLSEILPKLKAERKG